jgi:hypothetical protein
MKHLDIIAKSETNTPRPHWKFLNYGDALPSQDVIKRTHSDCGNHVLRPGHPDRNWEYIYKETIQGSRWFSQRYVPELTVLGEWRVFVIGGDIISVVHTIYNGDSQTWRWEMVHSYYTLEELR